MPTAGTSKRAIEMDRRKVAAEHVHVEIGKDIDFEIELRHQVAQRIEANATGDARDSDVSPGAQRGAGLHGGRGNGEIALERNADDTDVIAHPDAVERCGNVGRNLLE